MQVVSNDFREQAYSGGAIYTANLTINGRQVPVNQIAKITIDSPIIDTSTQTYYVGSFISQSISIKFRNLDGLDIQSNNLVYLEIGQLINGEYEYVPIGYYLIDDLGENYQETCEITCLDYGVKFKNNIDYSPCFTDGKADVNTIVQYICDYFGVELGTDLSQLPNAQIETGDYDSTKSGKLWLSYIAETKGCNLKINRQGQLIFVPLKQQPSVTINALKSKEWKLGEKYQISRVVYFDALRKFEYGDEQNNTLYIRQDNPFITDTEVVENIYNAVENFTIWSLKNANYGDVSLDAWDIINFTLGYDDNDNLIEYQTYNNNKIVYEMNIMTEISTQIPTKQKEITTNILGGDEKTNIRMIKTNLDYINNRIELMAQEQINTEERLNQTIIDATSTKNIFQITGGSNIIKNSQFLYNDIEHTYWSLENNGSNPYNNMGKGYDAELIGKTTSIAKIQLRDTIASTTDKNITDLKKNQTYTLNYSYKQDDLTETTIELIEATSGNTIYSKIIDEEHTEFVNENFQFIAEDSSYIFRITTETTNSEGGYIYIYDLMLNSGDKRNWELAAGEIYSTVIQLSQLGLQVVTADEDIITLLTSQGFQVRRYNNGNFGAVITQFTNTGLLTEIAETKEVHTGKYIMKEITINNIEHHVEYFKG